MDSIRLAYAPQLTRRFEQWLDNQDVDQNDDEAVNKAWSTYVATQGQEDMRDIKHPLIHQTFDLKHDNGTLQVCMNPQVKDAVKAVEKHLSETIGADVSLVYKGDRGELHRAASELKPATLAEIGRHKHPLHIETTGTIDKNHKVGTAFQTIGERATSLRKLLQDSVIPAAVEGKPIPMTQSTLNDYAVDRSKREGRMTPKALSAWFQSQKSAGVSLANNPTVIARAVGAIMHSQPLPAVEQPATRIATKNGPVDSRNIGAHLGQRNKETGGSSATIGSGNKARLDALLDRNEAARDPSSTCKQKGCKGTYEPIQRKCRGTFVPLEKPGQVSASIGSSCQRKGCKGTYEPIKAEIGHKPDACPKCKTGTMRSIAPLEKEGQVGASIGSSCQRKGCKGTYVPIQGKCRGTFVPIEKEGQVGAPIGSSCRRKETNVPIQGKADAKKNVSLASKTGILNKTTGNQGNFTVKEPSHQLPLIIAAELGHARKRAGAGRNVWAVPLPNSDENSITGGTEGHMGVEIARSVDPDTGKISVMVQMPSKGHVSLGPKKFRNTTRHYPDYVYEYDEDADVHVAHI